MSTAQTMGRATEPRRERAPTRERVDGPREAEAYSLIGAYKNYC